MVHQNCVLVLEGDYIHLFFLKLGGDSLQEAEYRRTAIRALAHIYRARGKTYFVASCNALVKFFGKLHLGYFSGCEDISIVEFIIMEDSIVMPITFYIAYVSPLWGIALLHN